MKKLTKENKEFMANNSFTGRWQIEIFETLQEIRDLLKLLKRNI